MTTTIDDVRMCSPRPRPLSHSASQRLSFAHRDDVDDTVSVSDSDLDSFSSSLHSRPSLSYVDPASRKRPPSFNELTWAAAYSATVAAPPARNANPGAPGSGLALASRFDALPSVLDWLGDDEDEDGVGESDQDESVDLPPKDPPARLMHSAADGVVSSKRFSDLSATQRFQKSPIFMRHRSLSDDSADAFVSDARKSSHAVLTSEANSAATKYKPHRRRFSRNAHQQHASHSLVATSNGNHLDDDDRFINSISTRLQEFEQQDLLERQKLEHAGTSGLRRSSFISNLLFGSDSHIESSADAATMAPPTRSSSASNVSNASQTSRGSIVSFISRAFGPRRNLQTNLNSNSQQRSRPISLIPSPVAAAAAESGEAHTSNLSKPHRASMPHVAWSSWSSGNSSPQLSHASANQGFTPSGQSQLLENSPHPHQKPFLHHRSPHKPHIRFSGTNSTGTSLIPSSPGSSRTTSPLPVVFKFSENSLNKRAALRTQLGEALKLFEMGATEAAFVTFQRAADTATVEVGSDMDAFAKTCVAVCILHGYGCAPDWEEGSLRLHRLRDSGESFADFELKAVGVLQYPARSNHHPKHTNLSNYSQSKGTTIKDAIKIWEEKNPGQTSAEATIVKLITQQPFIVKMDASLATLVKVEQLALSTNMIEKISNLNGLNNLRVLSLGRNMIKKIEGLDAVSDTLEELWISYNQIERLNGIECCKKLKVLYASNNKIKAWEGITSLQALSGLEDLLLVGNPLEEKCTADGNWVSEISKKFPSLRKLDGKPIIREDAMEDEEGKE
ncbi:Dynein light chain 1, axonemal [Chytriomyces hyalinus]|nr:Dynein light chain 1, axonemal [Chytriomyces hyalinus]